MSAHACDHEKAGSFAPLDTTADPRPNNSFGLAMLWCSRTLLVHPMVPNAIILTVEGPRQHGRNGFMHKCKLAIFATALSAITFSALPVSAGSLDGTWLRPKTGKKVKSFACGGGLGLRVIHSGKVIMCGAKSQGDGSYRGSLTSTEDGKTYTGIVSMSGNTLNLSGCALGGLICKNETWSRVK